jgi:hypothetical protein
MDGSHRHRDGHDKAPPESCSERPAEVPERPDGCGGGRQADPGGRERRGAAGATIGSAGRARRRPTGGSCAPETSGGRRREILVSLKFASAADAGGRRAGSARRPLTGQGGGAGGGVGRSWTGMACSVGPEAAGAGGGSSAGGRRRFMRAFRVSRGRTGGSGWRGAGICGVLAGPAGWGRSRRADEPSRGRSCGPEPRIQRRGERRRGAKRIRSGLFASLRPCASALNSGLLADSGRRRSYRRRPAISCALTPRRAGESPAHC